MNIKLRGKLIFLAIVALYLAYAALYIFRSSIVVNSERYFCLCDEAMISMRYAQRLLDGKGLTWNDGERVEGYSNFLWTLSAAALGAMRVNLIHALRFLGLLGMWAVIFALVYTHFRWPRLPWVAVSFGAAVWVLAGPTAAWVIGGLALYWAYSPPALITEFYTAAVGLISAGLFVPTIAGLWWKKANLAGGLAALVTGTMVYALLQFHLVALPVSPILVALPASGLAMWVGGRLGAPEEPRMLEQIGRLHEDEISRT